MRFADTTFWVALRFRDDPRHEPAARLWAGATGPVITTNLVVGETWSFVRRKLGHAVAVDFLSIVERSPRVAIEFVDEATEREAWNWLRRHDERPYSFVDATSFAVMRRLRLRDALAFDGDFAAAGFTELRP